jgi:CheY-like chemotaxis protein/HPt (histidine-containing phosphotransfer) domain-containing protein
LYKEDYEVVNIEYLYLIPELKMAWAKPMTLNELKDYLQSLEFFIDSFPAEEEKIKIAMAAKDYAGLSRCLSVIRDMLVAIYADELAQESQRQIYELKNVKHEKLEAFMAYFLKTLSMLSIDIQMAILKNQEDEQERPALKEPVSGTVEANEKKTVLAVDDTPFFLAVLKKALQDVDFRLTCVTSGMDALRYLEKHKPDVFLLDIDMPEMDGYELAAKIREIGQKAPIVFLTGNAKKENVVKAVKAGAADFIVKPINKEEILSKIGRYIS